MFKAINFHDYITFRNIITGCYKLLFHVLVYAPILHVMKFNYFLTYSFTNIFRSLYMYMYDACPSFLIYPPEDVVS